MKMKTLPIFCCVITVLCSVLPNDGYRILGIYSASTRNHFFLMEELFKGLARKGHQVDVISTIQQSKPYPNYTDIIKLPLINLYGRLENNVSFDNITVHHKNSSPAKTIALLGNNFCEHLGNPELLKLAKSPYKNKPYDVVITQVRYLKFTLLKKHPFPILDQNSICKVLFSHCFHIFGHIWDIPIVGVSTNVLYPWVHEFIGDPENFAIAPNNLYQVPLDFTNFWTRLYNICLGFYGKLSFHYHSRKQDDILRKYFGENVPSVRDLEKRTSLILVNSHFLINGVKPSTIGLIEVGGIHIQNKGPNLEDVTTNLKH